MEPAIFDPLTGEVVRITDAEFTAWLNDAEVPEMDDAEALAIFRQTAFLHRSVKQ